MLSREKKNEKKEEIIKKPNDLRANKPLRKIQCPKPVPDKEKALYRFIALLEHFSNIQLSKKSIWFFN